MPQSLANVMVHLVFSTRNRAPTLDAELRERLYGFLVGGFRNNGCDAIQIGGVEDHIHILFRLSRTVSIAQIVERAKASSSSWIKVEWPDKRDFAWQAGYGATSVGPSQSDGLVLHIRTQEEHHRKVSFQDEYRAILKEAGIKIDDRYAWD